MMVAFVFGKFAGWCVCEEVVRRVVGRMLQDSGLHCCRRDDADDELSSTSYCNGQTVEVIARMLGI